jgi:adenine-specific DNA-methyltransferase
MFYNLSEKDIIAKKPSVTFENQNQVISPNKLIHGDNLLVMKCLLENGFAEKIDLVYIDPPFATNNVFTFSAERTSTISQSKSDSVAYSDKFSLPAFLNFLGDRLVLLRQLMSKKGSIYVHTDYKIGHYVRVLMDDIFGIENFRNDITRIKCNPKNFARKGYGNIKDMILFYSKTSDMIWHEPKEPYTDEDKLKLFPKIDINGRRYTTIPLHAPNETQKGKTAQAFKGILPPKGRHWRTDVGTLEMWDEQGLIEWSENGNPRKKIYFDEQEGKRMQDIWEMKDPQYPVYPTEKNAEIANLIIKTSSNPDSYVLDCFCGSGTTLKSAHLLGRHWIGIDQSEQAIKVSSEKMNSIVGDMFVAKPSYEFVKCEEAIPVEAC